MKMLIPILLLTLCGCVTTPTLVEPEFIQPSEPDLARTRLLYPVNDTWAVHTVEDIKSVLPHLRKVADACRVFNGVGEVVKVNRITRNGVGYTHAFPLKGGIVAIRGNPDGSVAQYLVISTNAPVTDN